MPVTNISLLRSYSDENPPANPPSSEPPYVPFYSVLFYYKNISEWAADDNVANNGAISVDYYRRYYISDPKSLGSNFYYYDSSGNRKDLFSFPVIKCVDTNTGWKNNLGKLEYPTTTVLSNAATLLENGGGHNPAGMLRTEIKPIQGFKTGDTQDAIKTYIDRTSPHGGHVHAITGIYNALLTTSYGNFYQDYFANVNPAFFANKYLETSPYVYEIETLIRDPKLAKKSAKLEYLPKNIIVFGDDLPTEYFTRTHPDTTDDKNPIVLDIDALPILAKYKPDFISGDENLKNVLVSNNSGAHTHSITSSTRKLSTVTGQTMYTFNTSGNHTHQATYFYDVTLKSKRLKAWFTLSANTPIANGIIIAYSNGVESGYDGSVDDDSVLPPYWHFCDGTNGTPDLRDYYVCFNFVNSDHDTVVYADSEITLSTIIVQGAGNHSHYSPTSSVQDGTPITLGSHGFEVSLNHVHGISAATSFKLEGSNTPVTNFRPNVGTYGYTPPTTRLAFIMYNENIP